MEINNQNKQLKIQRLSTFILPFMAVGTLTELLLIAHFEDLWQLIPIVLISASLLSFIVLQWKASESFLKLFKALMIGCVISGVLGAWFHLQANMEFEMELHPNDSMITLIKESISGALPTLAPGSMIVFGLIGYLYTLIILTKEK